MIASAGTKDWSGVSAQLSAVQQAWSALRPAAAARGASPGLLDALDSAVAAVTAQADALSVRGTQVAANRLTGYVPDLLVLYSSPAPPQLAEMQFLARAMQLDVRAGRTAPLWTEARTAGTQWAFIRASARRTDATDATAVDQELAALGTAISGVLGGAGVARPASVPLPTAASTASSSSAGTSITAASGLAPGGSAARSSASASAPATSRSGSSAGTTGTASSSAPAAPSGGGGGGAPSTTPLSAVSAAAAQLLQTLGSLQRAYQGG
jgi:hypothetical protein